MKKRLLSTFMALAMVLTMLPTVALATEDDTTVTWATVASSANSGTDYTVDGGGDVTISTAVGLAWLSASVNGTLEDESAANTYADKTVTLNSSLDLEDAGVTDGQSWTPIGTEATPFTGTFDGNGNTISGLYVNVTGYAGLFSYVSDGTVKNVSVSGSVTADSSGYDRAGGIVGYNYGTVTNCSADVTVTATSRASEASYAGGVVGWNDGTVSNCYATGDVSASASVASYAGGVVGRNNGTVSNCYATGDVSASATNTTCTGGVVGTNSSTVTDCYWKSDTTDTKATAGIGGGTTSTTTSFTDYGTLSSSVTVGSYTGTDLLSALNAWVNNKADETYCTWVQGGSYPYFLDGDSAVLSINLTSTDHKTVYYVDDTLDVTDLTITATYTDDSTVDVTVTADMVSGFDSASAVAEQTLTITYNEKTTTYTVAIVAVATSTIAVNSTTHKTAYYVGDSLDVTALTILVTKNNGATETVDVTADMVSGFDATSAVSSQTLTITYEGKTTAYTVEIVAIPILPSFTTISTSRGNGYVTISWAVADNGVELTGYVLTMDGETTYTDIGTDATSYTVSGLTNGTTYSFVLTAETTEDTVDSDTVTGTPYKSSYFSSITTTTTTTTDTPETTTNDDGSVTATVETDTTTSGGVTSTTVDDDTIDDAIETAVEEADGEDAHIELTVDTTTSTDTVEVELTTDALASIADSDVESLTITTDIGSITITSDGLSSIAGQAVGTEIVISIALVDIDDLTDAQKAVIGDGLAFNLTITSGDETISNFGGYEITAIIPYTLKDGESAESIVVWHVSDDGTVAVMDTSYDEEIGMATFVTTHFSVFAMIHDTNIFTDVDINAYYYNAVMWAVENSITNGTTDTAFSPDMTCTRAQAVTLLWKAYGSPVVDYINPFTDINAEDYYYEAVLWAVSEGITSGTDDTTFSPNADCTRGQIVTFLYRAAGEPEVETSSSFTDTDADSYCYDAVLWAVENGITNGTTDTTFSPNSLCNRGQIVTFLYRNMGE